MPWDSTNYLQKLSEAELFEAYYLVRATIGSEMSIYMTLLFGFLTVTYFVGEKLKSSQALALVALYSFFSFWMGYSIYGGTRSLAEVWYVMSGVDTYWSAYVNLGFLMTCWIVSIILFIQARKSGDA